eukprot:366426-Chlamydomonas_euryale.AAC.12
MVSGPGSADILRWKEPEFKHFLQQEPFKRFASMLTSHFYTHRSTMPGTSHETFLSEEKVRTGGLGEWVCCCAVA